MKRFLPIVVLLAVAVGVYLAAFRARTTPGPRSGIIQASGHVEGEHTVIAARSAGRITEILVSTGEAVARGQVVARLEDVRASERVSEARRTLSALESKLRSEQVELAILQTKAPLAIKAGEANVSLTHAALQECENVEDVRRQEVERLRAIDDPDDEAKRELDKAELDHEDAQRQVIVAQAAVERAERDLDLARAGEDEIKSRIEEVEALRADRDNADAALATLQNAATGSTVVSPSDGIIADWHAAVGDDAQPGTALFEIVPAGALCIVVQLADTDLQGVTAGEEARVYLEDAPEQPLDARVTGVTPSEDGAGMWRVRLSPAHAAPRPLVLGMRAEVVIRVRDGAKWTAPRPKG
jgi:HlyD family secretion protein